MKNKIYYFLRRHAASLCILLVLLTAGGTTIAYFTDNEYTVNKVGVSNNTIEVVEEFDEPDPTPVQQFKKSIAVRNTGKVPCYVRVFVGFSDRKIREITTVSADGETFYPPDDFLSHLPAEWVYIPENDPADGTLLGGYFYYREILPPADPGTSAEEELTAKLTDSFKTTFASKEDIVPYEIYVYAESVQILDRNGSRFTGENAWRSAWKEFLGNR